MATVAELTTELTTVKTAIAGVMARGQAVGNNGRSMSRADLGQLFKERARLERAIARKSGTGGMRRAVPR